MTKPKSRIIKGWRQVERGPGRPALRNPHPPAPLQAPAAPDRTAPGPETDDGDAVAKGD